MGAESRIVRDRGDVVSGAAGGRDAENGVPLVELLATLSLVTDLANDFPPEKGLRNCVLAVLIGRELGLRDRDAADVFYFGLLRSIGCTSYAYEEAVAVGDDTNFRSTFAGLDSSKPTDMLVRALTGLGAGRGPIARVRAVHGFLSGGRELSAEMSRANCEAGARLADRLGLGAAVVSSLANVHERWDGKGIPSASRGEEVPLAARIGCFAHDVTVHLGRRSREEVLSMVRARAGGQHDPAVAAAFLGRASGLLDVLEHGSAWDAVMAYAPPSPSPLLASRLDEMCRVLADFTDLKSPWTLGHSSGVARLAEGAARILGCPDHEVDAVRRAGLLHDLGRVGVSNAVWDKPGPLTPAEWERVRLHPYHTERVLQASPAFRPLARIAAGHHERLDGSGYHRGDPAAIQSRAARILAVADRYHGMIEPRPYRAPIRPVEAARVLSAEAAQRRLDADAVRAVLDAAGQRTRVYRRWPAELTGREVDVLRLAARGRSNRAIAESLFISENTVKTHMRHINEKAGVSTRAGLALFAMENDLIDTAE